MRRFPRRDLLLLSLVGLAACGAPTVASSGTLAPPATTPTRPPAGTATPARPAATPAASGTPAAERAAAAGQTFVGRLDRSDALVALVLEEGRAIGYVCDGQSLAAWFGGTVSGDALDLRAADGTQLIAAVRVGPSGAVAVAPGGAIRTPDGQERAFATADTATLDRVAGLYQAQSTVGDQNLTLGVIAMSRSLVRGVLWRNNTPAPIGDPTFGANRLTAPVAGVGTFTAFRLTSPP